MFQKCWAKSMFSTVLHQLSSLQHSVCIGELRIPTAVSFVNKMSSRSCLMLDLEFSTVWGFLCCFVVSICCHALCTNALSYHHELWLLNCGLIPLQMVPFPFRPKDDASPISRKTSRESCSQCLSPS